MAELMAPEEFRVALEDAIKGREAKNASFSQAWANGELSRSVRVRPARPAAWSRVSMPGGLTAGRVRET